MHLGKIIRTFDGVELYRCENVIESPKAAVVIVHGLGEHAHRYDYVTEKLNRAGYDVIRYDQRGHGRSGGAHAYLGDYNLYIDDADYIVEDALRRVKQVFMLGHSVGGFVAAAYGIRYGDKLAGQIFSAPCTESLPDFESQRHIDLEQQSLHLVANFITHLICRDQGVVEEYIRDPLVLRAYTNRLLHEIFIQGIDWLMASVAHYRCPCLIVHGEGDKIVPVKSSQFLYDHCSATDKTFKTYPLLYHEILNEPAEKDGIINDIVKWMDERVIKADLSVKNQEIEGNK